LALALLTVGLILCGVGWAGLGAARIEGSLLARLAPRTVTITGTLREDPEPSPYGWHALVDVGRVEWSGGAAAVRETVWVSGNDEVPAAVRGDQLQVEGTLQLPRSRFRAVVGHRGLGVSVRAFDVQRLGGAPAPFIRLTRSCARSSAARSNGSFRLARPGCSSAVLGDASKLDPVTTRDFQTTGLGHLLVVSGENVAMVLAPVVAFAGALRSAPSAGSRWGSAWSCLRRAHGGGASVLRAGAMASLALIESCSESRGRRDDPAAAVLALLVLDPWLVNAIGFQPSVAATAGMVTLATRSPSDWAGSCPCLRRWPSARRSPPSSVTPLLCSISTGAGRHDRGEPRGLPGGVSALLLGIAASVLVSCGCHRARGVVHRPDPMRYLEIVASTLAKAPIAWITSGGGPWVLIVGAAAFVAIALGCAGWRPAAGGRRRGRADAAACVAGGGGRRAARDA
jgi:hypothetical protein